MNTFHKTNSRKKAFYAKKLNMLNKNKVAR